MRTPLRSNNRYRPRQRGNYSGNPLNRVYDSTGPEGKVRGTPQQIIDKYEALSQDASTAGDHVAAENYLQHAEHYARILSGVRRMQEKRRQDRKLEAERDASEPRASSRRIHRDNEPDSDRGENPSREREGEPRMRGQRSRRSNGAADGGGRRGVQDVEL